MNTRLFGTPIPLEEMLQIEVMSAEDGDIAAQQDEGVTRERQEIPRRADQPKLVAAGAWEVSTSLRAFKAEDVFVGTQELDAPKRAGLSPIGEFVSLDVTMTRYLSKRWSLAVAVPLLHSDVLFLQGDGQRRSVDPGTELGDIRLTARTWLRDPGRHRAGNVALGFGLKLPTGDREVRHVWHTAGGTIDPPVDQAQQPGDGGFGFLLDVQGFQLVAHRTFVYGDGVYLISPKRTNGVVSLASGDDELSVPDQYVARFGVGYFAWPRHGVSLSLGARIDGVPKHDLIGGSDGFRRPGYSLSVEPGVNVAFGSHVFSLNVPIAWQRSRQQSVLEERAGVHPGGVMAGEAFLLSYSRRF